MEAKAEAHEEAGSHKKASHWVAEKERAGGEDGEEDSCVICMERRAITSHAGISACAMPAMTAALPPAAARRAATRGRRGVGRVLQAQCQRRGACVLCAWVT